MNSETTKGECRCGQLRIRVRGRPLMTMACHCTGCQKMTASAFSLSAMFPSAAFEVVEGETAIGGLHGGHRHHFCAHCLTWAFTRPEGMDDFVNVRTAMLDDAASFAPFIETYLSEKLPWATTPAEHGFDKFPPLGDFPTLMQQFAERNG